jgi:hypothetical protein
MWKTSRNFIYSNELLIPNRFESYIIRWTHRTFVLGRTDKYSRDQFLWEVTAGTSTEQSTDHSENLSAHYSEGKPHSLEASKIGIWNFSRRPDFSNESYFRCFCLIGFHVVAVCSSHLIPIGDAFAREFLLHYVNPQFSELQVRSYGLLHAK